MAISKFFSKFFFSSVFLFRLQEWEADSNGEKKKNAMKYHFENLKGVTTLSVKVFYEAH